MESFHFRSFKAKEEKWYDDRIAIRKENLKKKTLKRTIHFFEYYPLKEGLHFLPTITRILKEKGVEIRLGQPIESIQFEEGFIVKTKEEK